MNVQKRIAAAYLAAFLLCAGCTDAPPPPAAREASSASAQPSVSPKSSASPNTAQPEVSAVPAPPAAAPSAPSPTPTPALRSVSFETELPPSSKNRLNNLRVVAEKLDGVVIPAGETFSFNKSVGPRTVKAGYRKATMFINKKEVQELGGGICQMSTTLYNAALLLELPIVERHEHSREVAYIEKGRDATISYGSMDLIFQNSTPGELVIHASVDKKKVHVTLTEKNPA